jgi:hypothetical protein
VPPSAPVEKPRTQVPPDGAVAGGAHAGASTVVLVTQSPITSPAFVGWRRLSMNAVSHVPPEPQSASLQQ